MFRRFVLPFCLIVTLLLGGCAGKTGDAPAAGARRYEVTLTGADLTVTGTAECTETGGSFTVTAPETLAGAVYTVAGEELSLTHAGITLPVTDTAWPVLLLRALAEKKDGGTFTFADCEAVVTPVIAGEA